MSELTEPKQAAHRVGVNLGYTRNMGNFESLRVDISLALDGVGNPNVTFDKAYAWCEAKLTEKVNEIEKELKS